MSVRTEIPTQMPKAKLFGIGFEPVLEYGNRSDCGLIQKNISLKHILLISLSAVLLFQTTYSKFILIIQIL